jgi:hypothetical protein
VTALCFALVAAERIDALAQGLRAQYFANPAWIAPAVHTGIEVPSGETVAATWPGGAPEAFSVSWSGSLITPRAGMYQFTILTEGGSAATIDGVPVLPDGGTGSRAAGVSLSAGVHRIFLLYRRNAAPIQFDLLWKRDGGTTEAVPLWTLRPRPTTILLAAPAWILHAILIALEALWLVLLAAIGVAAIRPGLTHLTKWLDGECDWRTLRWIVLGSIALNVPGVWWGLPGSWVGAEIDPKAVAIGVFQQFSHGWWDTYAPFHYYLLALLSAPVLAMQRLGWPMPTPTVTNSLLVLGYRAVSLVQAAGLVIATGLIGTYAFGRRAGLWAAALGALVAPFVHYAKTANVDVPYVFWFALSLVFYLRLLYDLRARDFLLFAAFAVLAICTKDQAYGLYVLTPFPILWRLWEGRPELPPLRRLVSAAFDGRLWGAAGVSLILFAAIHNVAFNWSGFVQHVRYIIGYGSQPYRLFDRGLAGQTALGVLTLRLVETSLGWPMFAATLVGLVIAAWSPRLRRPAIWLLMPAISYYACFLGVVLYNYDRFVLPICLVLTVFGGLALDRLLPARGGFRSWRLAAVVVLFAYTFLYAATVDVLMIGDSRYEVDRWLRAHASAGESVGLTGAQWILPNLNGFVRVDVRTIEELRRLRPTYFVVNADYARAIRDDTYWGTINLGLRDGTLGYRLVLRYRRGSPWPWLPGGHPDLVGPREDTQVFSMLRNVDPTIEVYRRDGAARYDEGRPEGAAYAQVMMPVTVVKARHASESGRSLPGPLCRTHGSRNLAARHEPGPSVPQRQRGHDAERVGDRLGGPPGRARSRTSLSGQHLLSGNKRPGVFRIDARTVRTRGPAPLGRRVARARVQPRPHVWLCAHGMGDVLARGAMDRRLAGRHRSRDPYGV